MNLKRLLIALAIAASFTVAGLLLTVGLRGVAGVIGVEGNGASAAPQLTVLINELCEAGLCTVSIGFTPERLPFVSRGFMLFSTLTAAGVATAAYYYWRPTLSYREALRRQVTEFLPIAASLAQTKSTTLETLRFAASLVENPMRSLILRLMHLISAGEDPEEAARKVTADAPIEVRVVFDAIAVGAKSGGRFGEVLERSNKYFTGVFMMEKSVKDRLSEYKLTALLASFSFLAAALVALKLISSIASGLGALTYGPAVNLTAIESVLFISSIVVSTMASLVVGKVIEGSLLKSAKYIALTMVMNGLGFSLYPLML